jgi:hypothetical protein
MTKNVDEAAYDALRLRQWQAGEASGFSRRAFLALAAAASAGAVLDPGAASADTAPASSSGPIVKPLPPDLFTVFAVTSVGPAMRTITGLSSGECGIHRPLAKGAVVGRREFRLGSAGRRRPSVAPIRF